jgi:hypothetical protein
VVGGWVRVAQRRDVTGCSTQRSRPQRLWQRAAVARCLDSERSCVSELACSGVVRAAMPVRRGHVAPRTTIIETIIRKFDTHSEFTTSLFCSVVVGSEGLGERGVRSQNERHVGRCGLLPSPEPPVNKNTVKRTECERPAVFASRDAFLCSFSVACSTPSVMLLWLWIKRGRDVKGIGLWWSFAGNFLTSSTTVSFPVTCVRSVCQLSLCISRSARTTADCWRKPKQSLWWTNGVRSEIRPQNLQITKQDCQRLPSVISWVL